MTENDSVELRSLQCRFVDVDISEFEVFFMNRPTVNSKLLSEVVSADVNVFIAEFAELRSLGS